MDENIQSFQEKKDLLENELADVLLDAVEREDIKLIEIKPIAKEILVDLKKASNIDQLINFLADISKKWSFFTNLYNKYKGKKQQEKEKQVIEKLSSYIHNLN